LADQQTEITLYERDQIKITNIRVILEDDTYTMDQITSVNIEEKFPSFVPPLLLIAVAIAIILLGVRNTVGIGLAIIIGLSGIAHLFFQSPVYLVVIHHVVFGKIKAFSSTDEAEAKGFVTAIHRAIGQRG